MTRRYLLIDDNEAFAENLAEILRDTGATVDVAHEGTRAMELVAEHRYDALVTDMRMPGMTGAELLREIRRLDPGVPAILLSAYSLNEQLRSARRDGLLAVLSKPQEIPKFLQLLASARRDGAVLLVEDDVALADNLSEALTERGLTALTANELSELPNISGTPFAALVDLHLPDARSVDALSRVQERWPEAKTIVMTAFVDEAAALGATELVQKPFDTRAVLERLERWYRRGP